MAPPLPGDLIADAKEILVPHMRTQDDRDAHVTEAFYLAEQRLYHDIALEGTPNTFTVLCIKKLLTFGCLNDRQHALARLLRVVRRLSGLSEQNRIDGLCALLDADCASALPEHAPALPIAAPPPVAPTQSIATPPPQRSPTVYLCHAPEDAATAERLLAPLRAAGHVAWVDDASPAKGDEAWVRAVSEGMNNSYAVVVLASQAALDSRWVGRELAWAQERRKPIRLAVLLDFRGEPFLGLPTRDAPALFRDFAAGVRQLVRTLPAPRLVPAEEEAEKQAPRPAPSRRARELAYLDRLRFEELVHTDKYARLAGTAQIARSPVPRERLHGVVMRPEFEHTPWAREHERVVETRKFEDAVAELLKIRRAVVLGEPGAGKTTTLWTLARALVEAALADPSAPIPLLIRLGKWTHPDQPLADFVARELDDLGAHVDTVLEEERAALLLDGLNELPVADREAKTREVQRLVEAHPRAIAVVTCREQDYTLDLGLDLVAIAPLDPLRIREFARRYLGKSDGDALFERLVGQHFSFQEREFRRLCADKLPDWEQVFWTARQPTGAREPYLDVLWEVWLRIRDAPANLLQLARNPYMLFMLCEVYTELGDLPPNRGGLFAEFVETLLVRERIARRDPPARHATLSAEATVLLQHLEEIALRMQMRRPAEAEGGATALPRTEILPALLTERELYLAASANLLSAGSEIRFTHQLLQEYFTARRMQTDIAAGALRAAAIWTPPQWWQRTNWEEATVLLAGLHSADCTPVVEWVADANPDVAAQCIVRGGAILPDATLFRLRAKWLPRLVDVEREPNPEGRANVGRALGRIKLSDGSLLDHRKGVGVVSVPSAQGATLVPDIDWVEVPEGAFQYGEKRKTLDLPTFWIARYPVTYAQFQAFVDAPDGFANPRWWDGLAADNDHRSTPGEQRFRFWNHPRDTVSWFDAVAFCRWLSARLGDDVRLPREEEWEKAARGTDGREYPWGGDDYVAGYANIDESYPDQRAGPHNLQSTSAVGMYPRGASPYRVMDMSGNVWEWCLNEREKPKRTQLSGRAYRVLRGGSWHDRRDNARCACRRLLPEFRVNYIGFRVVLRSALLDSSAL